jgi:mRNA interferase RelE/StbE
VEFTDKAKKQLKKLDKHSSLLIIAWIRKNLEDCDNPRLYGKPLVANKSEQWRYRMGDYRLLARIEDEKVIILIVNVGHRKDIYK